MIEKIDTPHPSLASVCTHMRVHTHTLVCLRSHLLTHTGDINYTDSLWLPWAAAVGACSHGCSQCLASLWKHDGGYSTCKTPAPKAHSNSVIATICRQGDTIVEELVCNAN